VTQSEVRIKLAQYLAESGEARRAIDLLEHDAGGDPDALIALGNAYTAANRLPDAIRTFRHVLELDPKNPLAWQDLGTAQLQAKSLGDAEVSLRRAIELDPSRSGAYTVLGVVLAATGRKTDAIAAWQRAVSLDPQDTNARDNLRALGRR